MSEFVARSPEQGFSQQAEMIMEHARENGISDSAWDAESVEKVLAYFEPLYKKTEAIAAVVSVGPCPQEGDECGEECEVPNTLTLTTVFGSLTISKEFDFYEAENALNEESDISPKSIAIQHRYLFNPNTGTRPAEEVVAEIPGVKVYPL